MLKNTRRTIRQRDGFVLSTELILVSSILILGLVGGLAALKSGISSELSAVASDFQEIRNDAVGWHVQSDSKGPEPTRLNCTETFDLHR